MPANRVVHRPPEILLVRRAGFKYGKFEQYLARVWPDDVKSFEVLVLESFSFGVTLMSRNRTCAGSGLERADLEVQVLAAASATDPTPRSTGLPREIASSNFVTAVQLICFPRIRVTFRARVEITSHPKNQLGSVNRKHFIAGGNGNAKRSRAL